MRLLRKLLKWSMGCVATIVSCMGGKKFIYEYLTLNYGVR